MKKYELYVETLVGSFLIVSAIFHIMDQREPKIITFDLMLAVAGLIVIMNAIRKYKKLEKKQ